MSSSRLTLLAVAVALLLFSLNLEKPGRPLGLDDTEPTVLLQIASLASSGEQQLDTADLETLYSIFPYAGELEVRLQSSRMGAPGYAEPLPYSLLAAPFWRVFGAAGPLLLNVLLWLTAWLACARLLDPSRQSAGYGLLFAGGALALGLPWPYVFRYRADIMVLAAVAVALCLAWPVGGVVRRHRMWLPVSGAILALALVHQPLAAIIGALLVVELAVTIGARFAARWLIGAAATLALLALLSWAWTGKPWPAGESTVQVFEVASPRLPSELELAPASSLPTTTGSTGSTASDRIVGTLVGRYRGVLPYLPFVLPALGLGLTSIRRRPAQQSRLLVALLAYGVALCWLSSGQRWTAELGEPRWLAALPVLLAFAAPLRVNRPTALTILGGFVLAAPLLLILTFQPLGSAAPGGALAGHTQAWPWRALPLERWRLGELPGWEAQERRHGRLWFVTADAESADGQLHLVAGSRQHQLWLESTQPLETIAVNLRAPPREQREVVLSSTRDQQALPAAAAGFEQLRLQLGPGAEVKKGDDESRYLYRLQVRSNAAEQAGWSHKSAGPAHRNPWPAGFAVGAVVTWLGPAEELDRDVFAVQWASCAAPAEVSRGDRLLAQARLHNRSAHLWPTSGAARVRLSYRWLRPDGSARPGEGRRTDLLKDVPPGGEVGAWQSVVAPDEPGEYVLESDLLYENVAWFSSRTPDATCRAAVRVR